MQHQDSRSLSSEKVLTAAMLIGFDGEFFCKMTSTQTSYGLWSVVEIHVCLSLLLHLLIDISPAFLLFMAVVDHHVINTAAEKKCTRLTDYLLNQ